MNWLQYIHHSAAVHFPMAMAVLMPITVALIWWHSVHGRLTQVAWSLPLVFAALQMITLTISYLTGVRSRVLSPATTEALDSHQRLATIFLLLWSAIAVSLVWHWLKPTSNFHKGITLVLLLVQLGIALAVGHLGGGLLQ